MGESEKLSGKWNDFDFQLVNEMRLQLQMQFIFGSDFCTEWEIFLAFHDIETI